jgi:hypothetical protein
LQSAGNTEAPGGVQGEQCDPVPPTRGPDNPTVTFGAFDVAGRPRVLYDMLWGLPRLGG